MTSKTIQLKQVFMDRIRSGTYPVGSRLPGVRSAARQYGVHANTVSRVYSDLAEVGLVRTVHGSGTYVIAVPSADQAAEGVEELVGALRQLAVQARRLGLSRRAWSRLVAEAEAAGFADDAFTMWFVECSPKDTEELSTSLSTLLERNVRPLLVDDLPHHLVARGSHSDFFITTPFHFDEVEAVVQADHPVVNVNVVPTSQTLVQFAQLDPTIAVSIVAANEPTLSRMARMIRTYTRIEPSALVLVDAPEAPEVVRKAEVLIDSQSIHNRVTGWGPTGKVYTVRYQIEPTSLAYLREVLRRKENAPQALPRAET